MREIFIWLSTIIFLYHTGMRPSVHTFASVRKQAGFEQCLVSGILVSGVDVIPPFHHSSVFLLVLMREVKNLV